MHKSSFIKIVFLIVITSATGAIARERGHAFSRQDSVKPIRPFPLSIMNNNPKWYSMVTNVPQDTYMLIHKDAVINKIPTYIGLSVLTESLMQVDQKAWKFNHTLYKTSDAAQDWSDLSVWMGDGKFQFALSAAFASFGLIEHDNRALKTASNISESVLAAGLVVQLLKRVTGRESPAASTESAGEWSFFPSIKEYQKDQPKYYSFPSGHLAAATAVLTVIANNYPDNRWIKPIGYTLLGVLGFSLVSRGMHWYSDLPLGFFLGYSMGNIIAPQPNSLLNRKLKPGGMNLSFSPFFGPRSIGFEAVCSF